MSELVGIDGGKLKGKPKEPEWTVWVVMTMCQCCGSKDFVNMTVEQNPFELECIECKAKDSFVTFVPPKYIAEMRRFIPQPTPEPTPGPTLVTP